MNAELPDRLDQSGKTSSPGTSGSAEAPAFHWAKDIGREMARAGLAFDCPRRCREHDKADVAAAKATAWAWGTF